MPQNHHEELDGCDHGATGKVCKADPQPTKGKDCLTHGNHGGVNEDHCLTTDTTNTTVTTVPTVTTTSTTTTAPAPATTTTTSGGVTTPTATATPSTMTQTSVATAPQGTATVVTVPASGRELPVTGVDTFDVLSLGIALVIGGQILRRRMRSVRRG